MNQITVLKTLVFGYSASYVINNQGYISRIKPSQEEVDVKTRLDRAGYLTIRLYHNGASLTRSVHRLVAETFIDNPNNLPIVNHKNGVRTDNRVENLEWVTHAENILHAHRTGLIAKRRRRRRVFDRCHNKKFDSVAAAARYYKIPVSTCRQYLVGSIPNKTCLQFEAA